MDKLHLTITHNGETLYDDEVDCLVATFHLPANGQVRNLGFCSCDDSIAQIIGKAAYFNNFAFMKKTREEILNGKN